MKTFDFWLQPQISEILPVFIFDDDSDFQCVCPGNFRQKLVKQNFSVI